MHTYRHSDRLCSIVFSVLKPNTKHNNIEQPDSMSTPRPAIGYALTRTLSIEETYTLHTLARRKSASEASRQNLRQKIGHGHLVEVLEQVIRQSPPPSPPSRCAKLREASKITFAPLDVAKREPRPTHDEYGFPYDDEDDEDSLSLSRIASRGI